MLFKLFGLIIFFIKFESSFICFLNFFLEFFEFIPVLIRLFEFDKILSLIAFEFSFDNFWFKFLLKNLILYKGLFEHNVELFFGKWYFLLVLVLILIFTLLKFAMLKFPFFLVINTFEFCWELKLFGYIWLFIIYS